MVTVTYDFEVLSVDTLSYWLDVVQIGRQPRQKKFVAKHNQPQLMSRGPPRRAFLRVAGSTMLASIAGCTADENPAYSPSESPTETCIASPTPTGTSSPTDEPVGTGNNPGDIVVVNQVESAQSISVQVDKQSGSTVFSETFELDGGERAGRDIFHSETAGVFVITAQLPDSTEESYEWDLSEKPVGGWLYISVEAGNKIEMTWAYA